MQAEIRAWRLRDEQLKLTVIDDTLKLKINRYKLYRHESSQKTEKPGLEEVKKYNK